MKNERQQQSWVKSIKRLIGLREPSDQGTRESQSSRIAKSKSRSCALQEARHFRPFSVPTFKIEESQPRRGVRFHAAVFGFADALPANGDLDSQLGLRQVTLLAHCSKPRGDLSPVKRPPLG
jgi:hypothetical protein